MNRKAVLLVVFVVGAVTGLACAGVAFVALRTPENVPNPPVPEPAPPPAPESKTGEPLPGTAYELLAYLPDPVGDDKLDPHTAGASRLLRQLLPSRKDRFWPTRVVVESDEITDGKRTARLYLEKALKVEVVTLSEGLALTVRDKTGSAPAFWRLGQKLGDADFKPFSTFEEVRSRFTSLEKLAGVYMPGAEAPQSLLDVLNLELEPTASRVVDLPDNAEGAKCFEAYIRTGSNRVELTKAGGQWKIRRIAPLP